VGKENVLETTPLTLIDDGACGQKVRIKPLALESSRNDEKLITTSGVEARGRYDARGLEDSFDGHWQEEAIVGAHPNIVRVAEAVSSGVFISQCETKPDVPELQEKRLSHVI
jgi:hypothetical protein